jgi:hypothetical protein
LHLAQRDLCLQAESECFLLPDLKSNRATDEGSDRRSKKSPLDDTADRDSPARTKEGNE